MNENKLNDKLNPISLKHQTDFFFKKIKPNKIANNYLYNLKNNNNPSKNNNTLNIKQKYLVKISDLSKLSELNNISNTNQFNLNNTYSTVNTAPNQFKKNKLLSFKKINNIKKNIKLNYKKKFFALLSQKSNLIKNKSELSNSENKNNISRSQKEKKIYNNKNKTIEIKKFNISNYRINHMNNIKNKNIKKETIKKKVLDSIRNDSLINNTFEENIKTEYYNLDLNNTRQENSERLAKKESSSFHGESIKSINLIKDNNEKILNRLLLNKDNKSININIKYFFKKNIKNINWVFYKLNNIKIKTQKMKSKNINENFNIKKYNKNKNEILHGKSHNDINNKSKNPNLFFQSQKINLPKNKIFLRNNNNIILKNYKNRNISKTHKFQINHTVNDIFSQKHMKSSNKINKNILNNLLSKPVNQKSMQKKKNSIKYNKHRFNLNYDLPIKQINNIKNNYTQIKYENKKFDNNKNNKTFNRKINSESNLNFTFTNKFNKKNKNSIYNEPKKESKNIKNDKYSKEKSQKENKENYKTKKKGKKLFIKNNINIKKIYNIIKLNFELKRKKIKKKESRKSLDKILTSKNKDDSNSSSFISGISESDKSLYNENKDNQEYNEDEIESITKKLDFDEAIKLSNENIFCLENNKKYNEFKDKFDKRFNKNITIFKLLNTNFCNNYYIKNK